MSSQPPSALLSKYKTASIPSDYTIQVTGNPEAALSQRTYQKQQQLWQNPDCQYRQVPPYRPINKFLDRKSRPWGSNGIESVIVWSMFQGVRVKSAIAWLWRRMSEVFGVSERRFEARIGGEL